MACSGTALPLLFTGPKEQKTAELRRQFGNEDLISGSLLQILNQEVLKPELQITCYFIWVQNLVSHNALRTKIKSVRCEVFTAVKMQFEVLWFAVLSYRQPACPVYTEDRSDQFLRNSGNHLLACTMSLHGKTEWRCFGTECLAFRKREWENDGQHSVIRFIIYTAYISPSIKHVIK
jgi:hypothetical protein